MTTIKTVSALSLCMMVCLTAKASPFAEDQNKKYVKACSTDSRLVKLKYAQAKQVAQVLQATHIAKEGRVVADKRTNALWLKAKDNQLGQLIHLVHKLDRKVSQVLIKAYVISVDANAMDELGFEYNTRTSGSHDYRRMHMDLPDASARTGRFDFKIAELGRDQMLNVRISALASEGKGKVIASPELVSANHRSAYIATGAKVPFQERTGYGNTSVKFKKAVLSLKVTPTVLEDRQLLLDLRVKQDAVSRLDVKGVPAIDTRQIKTQSMIEHGKTLVLGGIYKKSNVENEQRIPYLSALPWIGGLFKHRHKRTKRKELMIFVTPYILSGNNTKDLDNYS